MVRIVPLLSGLFLATCLSEAWAQQSAVLGEDKLRELLKDIRVPDQWWYNDLAGAAQVAEALGKPLMVVFR